jgi:hypothetical protein
MSSSESEAEVSQSQDAEQQMIVIQLAQDKIAAVSRSAARYASMSVRCDMED